MRSVLQQLVQALDAGKPAAYCQVVQTRGSTPQKAGAAMLVFGDGAQEGTLGGGCVEAEVKRRAMAAMHQGHATVETFQLDHDYGWDDGLICGGRMLVLVDPLQPGDDGAFYRRLAQRAQSPEGGTLAIVFDDQKAGAACGAALLFDARGATQARRPAPGAKPDASAVAAELVPLDERPRPYWKRGVAYLPFLARCPLLIVGGGHVGQAAAALAASVDFDVTVLDDRESVVTEQRFPTAERIVGDIPATLRDMKLPRGAYCLIVTRGHHHDQRALHQLADRGAAYVGMIGSRRKVRMIFEDLESEGVPRAALDRVHAPVGIDIGSQTVPEIAVSIVAELIAHRNQKGRVPGRA